MMWDFFCCNLGIEQFRNVEIDFLIASQPTT